LEPSEDRWIISLGSILALVPADIFVFRWFDSKNDLSDNTDKKHHACSSKEKKVVYFSREPKTGLINTFEHVTLVLCLGKLAIPFNTEESSIPCLLFQSHASCFMLYKLEIWGHPINL